MTIEFTEEADSNFNSILQYIARDNVNAAFELRKDILENIKLLLDNPNMGVQPKAAELVDKGYKMLVVRKYLIFYFVKNNTIEIRYIVHGSRDYGKLLS